MLPPNDNASEAFKVDTVLHVFLMFYCPIESRYRVIREYRMWGMRNKPSMASWEIPQWWKVLKFDENDNARFEKAINSTKQVLLADLPKMINSESRVSQLPRNCEDILHYFYRASHYEKYSNPYVLGEMQERLLLKNLRNELSKKDYDMGQEKMLDKFLQETQILRDSYSENTKQAIKDCILGKSHQPEIFLAPALSEINRVEYLARKYEYLVKKFKELGEKDFIEKYLDVKIENRKDVERGSRLLFGSPNEMFFGRRIFPSNGSINGKGKNG